jgi:hypothetical protein
VRRRSWTLARASAKVVTSAEPSPISDTLPVAGLVNLKIQRLRPFGPTKQIEAGAHPVSPRCCGLNLFHGKIAHVDCLPGYMLSAVATRPNVGVRVWPEPHSIWSTLPQELEFILLTAARENEVCGMKWSEISWEDTRRDGWRKRS